MNRYTRVPHKATWGEFGADDELGRLNLLTDARRLAAAQHVRDGRVFLLSLPLTSPGGANLVPSRRGPVIEPAIRADGSVSYNYAFSVRNPHARDVVSDDRITLWTQYSTQWDGLGHWGQEFDADGDGDREIVYYNGFRAGVDVVGPEDEDGPSAKRLGLEKVAETGVQGRGTLIDLRRHFGDRRVLVGYDAFREILEKDRVEVIAGDILCLYTGWVDELLAMGTTPDFDRLSQVCAVLDGTDQRLLDWITATGVAAICADNLGVEALDNPSGPDADGRISTMPLHEHCLFKTGVLLGEMWLFSDLAAWLAQHDRHHFLLTAPPLRLPGTVGSPVSPVATV